MLVSSYYYCVGRVHDAHGDGHEGHGEFDFAGLLALIVLKYKY